jgi:hypothetical protein
MTQPSGAVVADDGQNTSDTEITSNSMRNGPVAYEEGSDGDGGERPVREKLKKTSIASLSQSTSSRPAPSQPAQSEELHSQLQSHPDAMTISNDLETGARGRPTKKRSFDDLQEDDTQNSLDVDQQGESVSAKNGLHKRMRSRDITTDNDVPPYEESETEIAEPEESGEEEDAAAQRSPGGPGILVEARARATTPPGSNAEEKILSPKKKRSRDQFDKDHIPKDAGSEASGESSLRLDSDPADEEQSGQIASRTATGEPEKKRHRELEQVLASAGNKKPQAVS